MSLFVTRDASILILVLGISLLLSSLTCTCIHKKCLSTNIRLQVILCDIRLVVCCHANEQRARNDWIYFMINDQRKADCKLCSAKISIEEATVFAFTPVRNLIKHLQHKHQHEEQHTAVMMQAKWEKMSIDNASWVKRTACTQYIVLDHQPLSVLDNEELWCNENKNGFYLQLYRNIHF